MVVMEACASAHHWARLLLAKGIVVKLISPQFVAPFVKTNKNDRNDAEGNCGCALRQRFPARALWKRLALPRRLPGIAGRGGNYHGAANAPSTPSLPG